MAAIIPVNEQYRIELDTRSWQISQWIKRRSRSGGGSWEGCSWHTTLQQAGESLQRRLVAEDDLEGLQAVLDALHRSSSLIASAIAASGLPNNWAEQLDTDPDY